MSGDELDGVDPGSPGGELGDAVDPNSEAVGVDVVSGAGNPVADDADLDEAGEAGGFDPAEHTVDEVNAYLADHPDDAERVLGLEASGRNRVGIVGG